jgi:hypothetical protein
VLDAALLVLMAATGEPTATTAPPSPRPAAAAPRPTPRGLVTARIKQKGTILSRTRRDEETGIDQQLVRWDVQVENASDRPAEVTWVRTTIHEEGSRAPWDVTDYGADQIQGLAGTTIVPGQGSLQIPMRLYYDAPARRLAISVELKGRLGDGAFFTLTTEPVNAQ